MRSRLSWPGLPHRVGAWPEHVESDDRVPDFLAVIAYAQLVSTVGCGQGLGCSARQKRNVKEETEDRLAGLLTST
jgi:hypothetical protein